MDTVANRGHLATDASVQNNLPSYLTSFVGRDGDLRGLKLLLNTSRLITLVGAGGSGKTRLTAELVTRCLKNWPDGVWWVELAGLTDSGQVPGAVVAAMELPGRGAAQDVVIAWLAGKRALLVLDNCEHLVAACATFCKATLERCREVTVIATSQEPLGVPGEANWPLTPMRAPDALMLFEARARLIVPGFKVAAPNLESVGEICERLDGLPLAIEMAAVVRVDALGTVAWLAIMHGDYDAALSPAEAALAMARELDRGGGESEPGSTRHLIRGSM